MAIESIAILHFSAATSATLCGGSPIGRERWWESEHNSTDGDGAMDRAENRRDYRKAPGKDAAAGEEGKEKWWHEP